MYKHSAISIKETNDKMFITSEEKAKVSRIVDIDSNISAVGEKHDDINTQFNILDEYVKSNDTVLYEEIEGSYITVNNSMEGKISDIEILGNTIQDSSDLSIIKSVGKLRDDGLYEIELTSCGRNLYAGNSSNDFYIKLPIGEYTLSFKGKSLTSARIGVFIFNEDGTSLTNKSIVNDELTVVTLNNTKNQTIRIRYGGWDTGASIDYIKYMQLEKGIVNTPIYEEYKESTSKIILPCQLEKVSGSTRHDRLYFDKDKKKWCIEKYIQTEIWNGDESWHFNTNSNDTYLAAHLIGPFNNFNYGRAITNMGDLKKWDGLVDAECTWYHVSSSRGIIISKSKLSSPDTAGLKSYLQANNSVIKYATIYPEIIELPLDTQIQLNSFFRTTNVYMESGDVEGVIKCKISKSLGGSINSLVKETDVLSNRLEDIETLQEGNDISISADKGYVICKDTRDGYIKDIKIEGNTLVNLARNYSMEYINGKGLKNEKGYSITLTSSSNSSRFDMLFDNEISLSNKTIIVTVSSPKTTSYRINFAKSDDSALTVTEAYTGSGNHTHTFMINTNSLESFVRMRVYVNRSSELAMDDVVYMSIPIILDGDHTNNPPQYFEGLKSVGQNSDTITLSSSTKNLFDGEFETGGILWASGNNYVASDVKRCKNYVKVKPNMPLYASNVNGIVEYDKNKNFIKSTLAYSIVTSPITEYIRFSSSLTKTDIQVEIGKSSTPYKINKQDKKILFYLDREGNHKTPILRSISNSIKDTIEKHSDGKYYYHKRCGEVVLNGSEDWFFYSQHDENRLDFRLKSVDSKPSYSNSFNTIISDCVFSCLNSDRWDAGENGIGLFGTDPHFIMIIDKSNLSSQDTTSFKTWLKNNPITVVYELANEEVYECNNLDLISYDNETLVIVDSGDISPSKTSFKHTSHIGNIITNMKEDEDANTKFRERLTESVTLTKDVTNGYSTFENTKEGIASLEKIEGNSLVNLSNFHNWVDPNTKYDYVSKNPDGSWLINTDSIYYAGGVFFKSPGANLYDPQYENAMPLVSGKKYTFILKFKESASFRNIALTGLDNRNQVEVFASSYASSVNGICKFTFTSNYTGNVWLCIQATETLQYNLVNVILLEGDYTDNHPEYFEGLKSIGDLEENIEISSRKENGNLCNINELKKYIFDYDSTAILTTEDNKSIIEFNEAITNDKPFMKGKFKPNTQYSFSVSTKKLKGSTFYLRAMYTDGTRGNILYNADLTSYITKTGVSEAGKSIDFIYFTYGVGGNRTRLSLDDFIINEGTVTIPYEENKSNSKQILYKNSDGVYEKPILRSVNNTKDTIEKHSDGKYYYHKRCGEIVFDGSTDEDWKLGVSVSGWYVDGDTLPFYIPNQPPNKLSGGYSISSMFKTTVRVTIITSDEESFSLGESTYSTLRVNKSRLSATTVAGFKTWLQSNPITVVYELANEEIYECNNLDLESYDGDTGIFINAKIPANATAKVQSNLSDAVNSIKNRIHFLETKTMEMFKQILSGNAQSLNEMLYPETLEDNITDEKLTPEDIMTLEEI